MNGEKLEQKNHVVSKKIMSLLAKDMFWIVLQWLLML